MSWKKILKIEVRSLSDARRLGGEYAFEDMLESKILSQEDYNKLNDEQKSKYHSKIAQFYTKYGNSKSREARFHVNNSLRYKNNPSTAVNKPKPTTEKDFKYKKGGNLKAYNKLSPAEKARLWREKHPNDARGHDINPKTGLPRSLDKNRGRKKGTKKQPHWKPQGRKEGWRKNKIYPIKVNQMIVDYFKIYNTRFNRNPTLQDIEREEERPLTIDEIESFKTYSKRMRA